MNRREPKVERLSVTISARQMGYARKRAADMGVTLSDFIRHAIALDLDAEIIRCLQEDAAQGTFAETAAYDPDPDRQSPG